MAAACLTILCAVAQEKPPVVFLNGYQAGCQSPSTFESTFGAAREILQRDGRTVYFFDNCEGASKNAAIEDIGANFARFLDTIPAPQVDVVAHSMGGLIVRSYLTGKQGERGVFRPPADVKIRKAVFIGVPFFGAVATELPGAPNDVQSTQLLRGSTFLFDLATWNQQGDDLRGIDAVAIAGSAGTGIVPPLQEGQSDSTVSLTSASLEFTRSGQTRVLPYCHTLLSFPLSLGCDPANRSIANWTDEQHESARIALSFLNGTDAWRSIGTNVRDAATGGGVFIQMRDSSDRILPVESAIPLAVRSNEIAWNDRLPKGTVASPVIITSAGRTQLEIPVPNGGSQALVIPTGGPSIAGVLPSPGPVTPRVVAPGMFVSIYGSELATSTEQAQTIDYPRTLGGTQVLVNNAPVQLHYAAPQQVNAVVPDGSAGLVRMTVRNGRGERTVNVMVEPAVPSLFGAALNAVTGALITTAAPARPGDYVGLYLTGLGATERRGELDWAVTTPQVFVGGKPCAVLYAGRAPGYVGLDQINCQIAADAATGDAVQVSVSAGKRTGVSTLPVRAN